MFVSESTMEVVERKSKRRRKTRDDEDGASLEDGYKWCKYGEKPKIDSLNIRSYYRCNNKKTNCSAKKMVDKHKMCKSKVSVIYNGEHNHPPPVNKEIVVFHYNLQSDMENDGVQSNTDTSLVTSENKLMQKDEKTMENETNYSILNGLFNQGLLPLPCFNFNQNGGSESLNSSLSSSFYDNGLIQKNNVETNYANSSDQAFLKDNFVATSGNLGFDGSLYPFTGRDGYDFQEYEKSFFPNYGLFNNSKSCTYPEPSVGWLENESNIDQVNFQSQLCQNDSQEAIESQIHLPSLKTSKSSEWDLFDYLIAQDSNCSPSASDLSFQSSNSFL